MGGVLMKGCWESESKASGQIDYKNQITGPPTAPCRSTGRQPLATICPGYLILIFVNLPAPKKKSSMTLGKSKRRGSFEICIDKVFIGCFCLLIVVVAL
jgi:hypothetical protein